MKKGLLLLLLFAIILYIFWNRQTNYFGFELFHNIRPIICIDPKYQDINNDYGNYKSWNRVGDTMEVDLSCKNVNTLDLLNWMAHESPEILYECVYRYDPSIDIENPYHSARVLRMLLMNLPNRHGYREILRKCLPKSVQVA